MKGTKSKQENSGTADNPFAVFEIIADARRIQNQSKDEKVREYAKQIEKHAKEVAKAIIKKAGK